MKDNRMSKFLEVREFDKIHCNEEFSGQPNYLEEKTFNELEEFIYDFSEVNADDATAQDFLKRCSIKGIGKAISVNNYVGLIQTPKGNQIQVLPKMDILKPKGYSLRCSAQ